MTEPLQTIVAIAAVLWPVVGGAVAVLVRSLELRLGHVETRLKEHVGRFDEFLDVHSEQSSASLQRLSSIEAKVEIMLTRQNWHEQKVERNGGH